MKYRDEKKPDWLKNHINKINKYTDGYYTKIFDNKICIGKSKRLELPQTYKVGDFSVDKCAKAFKKWQDENGSAYKWFMYLPKGPVYKYNECVALKIKDQCKRLESPGVKPMPKYVTIPGGIRSFRRSFGLGGGKIIEKIINKQVVFMVLYQEL